ncbi:hypothetical protein MM817_03271 [Acidibacillus sp. S0AB]|uniref:Uncharacterized protein n=1 Tax=Sulfoacidibacillus ferrooxidans TaxID=2005001 RepID=A0A9X2ADJ3_9BACL|nr:hypothetical protein [Sulfoacidibacillus ferrooxidans]
MLQDIVNRAHSVRIDSILSMQMGHRDDESLHIRNFLFHRDDRMNATIDHHLFFFEFKRIEVKVGIFVNAHRDSAECTNRGGIFSLNVDEDVFNAKKSTPSDQTLDQKRFTGARCADNRHVVVDQVVFPSIVFIHVTGVKIQPNRYTIFVTKLAIGKGESISQRSSRHFNGMMKKIFAKWCYGLKAYIMLLVRFTYMKSFKSFFFNAFTRRLELFFDIGAD